MNFIRRNKIFFKYKSTAFFILQVSLRETIMSSITLTLTGNSSLLHTSFYPEIELNREYNYSCSLLDFYTYNSIPNINENNNKLHYKAENQGDNDINDMNIIVIPVGSYEINTIAEFLDTELQKRKHKFRLHPNTNTLKCKIESDVFIDFTQPDSIGSVFGFSKRKLVANTYHSSDKVVNIQTVNSIRIDCDLTSGSFHNGKSTHTIYEFSPSVDPGYKINEQPKHLIYLPLIRHRISELNISVVDQDGKLVDFRGEKITCRIHIKRDP